MDARPPNLTAERTISLCVDPPLLSVSFRWQLGAPPLVGAGLGRVPRILGVGLVRL